VRQWITLFFLLAALAAAVRAEPAPATAPTTEPTTQPISDDLIRQWFSDLASPDSTVRDNAQTSLMGLSRDDLSRLRLRVQRDAPLAPAQIAVLHDIVVQVYLSSQTYPVDANQGFLGLSWPVDFDRVQLRQGVPVVNRLPGCPAFRWLRDGDLILGITVEPRIALPTSVPRPTPSQQILQEIIEQAGPDRLITLDVLRQGQQIRVSLHLRPRPMVPLQTDQDFLDRWQHDGEAYWQAQFVPLLQAGIS
jgi:hypothetical protein